jgi:lipopolysaccharide transport system ATP-binding protein
MSNSIIEVNNISKRFRISHEREAYSTLRDKIAHPIKALKQIRNPVEDFWALNDVSFDVKRGEVMGIIGPNGSGKSTLLKVLSQITPPTKGHAILRGRSASLLEVGTGFHPELTGKENIYLSGVILGLTKSEINKKFDEIVDFAGVEKFLDTPVKRYSSGMGVRLGFAVAASLDSDILIIDEVLAVGDVEFQKKCLGKMNDITKNQGRTILFVSHDMATITSLCEKCIFLLNGSAKFIGSTNDAINYYVNYFSKNEIVFNLVSRQDRQGGGELKCTKAWIENSQGEIVNRVKVGDDIKLVIQYQKMSNIDINNISIGVALTNEVGQQLTDLSDGTIWHKPPDSGKIICHLRKLPLNIGNYSINSSIKVNGVLADGIVGVANFSVEKGRFFSNDFLPHVTQAYFIFEQDWELIN